MSARPEEALRRLLGLMQQLRDPQRGCPWDREQSFESIAPYTIEEAYEVADAIERGALDELRGELGDLLFQVVFHARMAEEQGAFDFAQVAEGISDKLVARHPHVFGGQESGVAPEALDGQWERLKAEERAARGSHGALAGVPRALPALARAAKIGRRAARVGFDWPDGAGARAKITEELEEVEQAGSASELSAEMGDLLFAVVSWARHLHVDAERALQAATQRFERRFHCMETLARERSLVLADLTPRQWDDLWVEAKKLTAG